MTTATLNIDNLTAVVSLCRACLTTCEWLGFVIESSEDLSGGELDCELCVQIADDWPDDSNAVLTLSLPSFSSACKTSDRAAQFTNVKG